MNLEEVIVGKVNLARGMRDFLPVDMRRRRWVLRKVRAVFERFGFEPLETPAMERLGTLLGKSGDEADRLLFRVLKRGEGGARGETDMALRYDLTVPLARVMAMNQGLPLPFRRYQLQPVWRADRPQRGRYREFLQCDVDTVGTTSPVADAECLAVVHASLIELGFEAFVIRLNHREILRSMVGCMGMGHLEVQVLVALDKLEKIGREGVDGELARRGVPSDAASELWRLVDAVGLFDDTESRLAALEPLLPERGRAAVGNLRLVLAHAASLGVPATHLCFDPTLARGLDYYTGAVFETVVLEPNIGSLSGGGRYDGLIGMFSGRPIPAVGVCLGIERILVVMDALGMLPDLGVGVQAMVFAMGEEQLPAAMQAATALRSEGVAVRLSPDPVRFKKAMKLASRTGAPWVVLVGPDEQASGQVTLRCMADRSQESLDPASAARRVRGSCS